MVWTLHHLAVDGRAGEHEAALHAEVSLVRLDLLRLHAGASDLAPLTTLLDAARRMGEEIDHLVGAKKVARGLLLRREETPV